LTSLGLAMLSHDYTIVFIEPVGRCRRLRHGSAKKGSGLERDDVAAAGGDVV
jgi:hypothetical protein